MNLQGEEGTAGLSWTTLTPRVRPVGCGALYTPALEASWFPGPLFLVP